MLDPSTISRPIAAALVGLYLTVTTSASALPGDIAKKFQVDDENPAANLPSLEERNENPLEFGYLIQDLIARGEGAFNEKNWERSVKYYEALAQAVPDRAVSFRRLCSGYAELGKIDLAAANCGKALTKGGTRVLDHFKFVTLMLKKAELTPADVDEIDSSIMHVRAHIAANPAPEPKAAAPETAPSPSAAAELRSKDQIKDDFLKRREERLLAELEGKGKEEQAAKSVSLPLELGVLSCKVAVRLRDRKRLDACLGELRAEKADERLVLPFEWAGALIDGDGTKASALIAKARTLALPEVAVKAMLEEQRRSFAGAGVAGFLKRWGLFALAGIGAAALAGFGAFWWFRANERRKRGVSQQASETPQASQEVTPQEG